MGDMAWLGSARPGRRQTYLNKENSPQSTGLWESVTLCVLSFYNGMEHRQVHSQRGRKERQTNRPCTICEHCLSCQIALLPGQRLSVQQSTVVSSQFGEHCMEGRKKKEQIKTFPGGHL